MQNKWVTWLCFFVFFYWVLVNMLVEEQLVSCTWQPKETAEASAVLCNEGKCVFVLTADAHYICGAVDSVE